MSDKFMGLHADKLKGKHSENLRDAKFAKLFALLMILLKSSRNIVLS